MILIVGDQAGPNVGVPCAHHLQNGNGDQGGQCQGDHDLPQILQITAAVHLSGQIQLVGDLHEVLAQQIDIEHAHQERHDQNGEGIHPAEGIDGCVVGDGEQLAGDHHGGKQRAKHHILALELQPGKGEGRKNGDHQRQDGGHDTNIGRVQKQLAQAGLGEGLGIVAQHDDLGPEGGDVEAVLLQAFQRGDDHPVEGEQHDQSHDHQEGIGKGLHEDPKDLGLQGYGLEVLLMHHNIVILCHAKPSLVMDRALADRAVDHGDDQNDHKQNQRSGRGHTVVHLRQFCVNIADHGIQAVGGADRAHLFAENTNDGAILLEAADEAGDDNIGQHGAQQRHGDAGEDSSAGSAVDTGSIVILLVDALQAAQQDQNLERQGVPDDIHRHNRQVGSIAGLGIDPVDGLAAEEHDDVVDDAPGIGAGAVRTQADDIEHCREHHADGDGVGDIGQEENGLQELLQGLDRVQSHSNQQSQQGGQRHGQEGQPNGVLQTGEEILIGQHFDEVANTHLIGNTYQGAQGVIVFQKSQTHCIDNGPNCKDQQQHNGR